MRFRFSSSNFPEYLSVTSSYFCRIANLPHLLPTYRSSRSQMLFIVGALKSFTIFFGKYLCWNLFLTKFVKKRLQHRCFHVNIVTFLRISFFIEHSGGCFWIYFLHVVAVAYKCSVEKVFLEISQNSHENTKKRKRILRHRCFSVNFANI